jgi:predicted site-specific integrase-resolvase
MATRNEINHIRTDTGRYLFDISTFLKRGNPELQKRKKICYARVSSRGQKSDLQNQIALLKTKFPKAEVISDYGSGLNFKRKGLQQILDLAHKGELEEIVVTYKDRLCRFGFELIEYIIKTQSNAKIVVLCDISTSKESELSADLLSIITVFSARMYGLRKYKKQIQEDENLLKKRIQTENETDDRVV